jgi:hypothetical protein
MSDKTKITMALEIAKTLSSLTKDQVKLTSDRYVHIDEIIERLPKGVTLGRRLFLKLKELIAAQKEDSPDPLIEIERLWLEGHKEIWKDIKKGTRKGDM